MMTSKLSERCYLAQPQHPMGLHCSFKTGAAKPVPGALACRAEGELAQHPAAAALARGSGPVAASEQLGCKGSSTSAICALAIHELNEEAIELIFTFLPVEDRRSAAAVCRLWRRVHNSSTKLWGSVLLSGERIVQASVQ